MARFIQVDISAQHNGITRVTRGFEALASLNITRAVLVGLAFVGAPVTRAAGKARAALATLAASRRQRRQDEKLWNIALSDARVMADLSRAMSRDALRDTRAYI
jgi:hypothetical protein